VIQLISVPFTYKGTVEFGTGVGEVWGVKRTTPDAENAQKEEEEL
jgi:hypothetical protein